METTSRCYLVVCRAYTSTVRTRLDARDTARRIGRLARALGSPESQLETMHDRNLPTFVMRALRILCERTWTEASIPSFGKPAKHTGTDKQ